MTADASTLMGNTKPGPGADQVMGDTLRWRTVLAATIGNTLEWYDFLVYGFLAMTLAKVFFPVGSELVSLFLSFGTFGIAAVARPIGGLILGVYADRAGRKAALTLTILIMGLGTGLIAVAPPYASIGVWAPLLIVAGRLLQGVGCGGEYGGATAILVESAPAGRRGLYGSWQTASVAAGFTLGAVATLLVSLAMTPAQLLAGGWRWPFAFGLLIVPVGVYVRSRLSEPDRFLRARATGPASGVTRMLRNHSSALLAGVGVAVLQLASAYVLFVYMPTFAVRQLRLAFSEALMSAAAAAFIVFVASPLLASASDRYGRKPFLLAGALLFATLTYPAFALVTARPGLANLIAIQSVFALAMGAYAGPAISVCAELFPTRLRATAMSLVYGATVAVVGGFAPLIVTWLIAATGSPLAPAFYVIGAAMISAITVLGLRDRFGDALL